MIFLKIKREKKKKKIIGETKKLFLCVNIWFIKTIDMKEIQLLEHWQQWIKNNKKPNNLCVNIWFIKITT